MICTHFEIYSISKDIFSEVFLSKNVFFIHQQFIIYKISVWSIINGSNSNLLLVFNKNIVFIDNVDFRKINDDGDRDHGDGDRDHGDRDDDDDDDGNVHH